MRTTWGCDGDFFSSFLIVYRRGQLLKRKAELHFFAPLNANNAKAIVILLVIRIVLSNCSGKVGQTFTVMWSKLLLIYYY